MSPNSSAERSISGMALNDTLPPSTAGIARSAGSKPRPSEGLILWASPAIDTAIVKEFNA
jgi:hypothetical protein